ncbi:MAG TPA: hypothetical protein VIH59_17350, partial [Candidatus Tectomicrobia bacterium]
MNLFHAGIQSLEGAEADQRRARAKICFEKATNLWVNIGQHDRAQAAQDWLLWLRLNAPTAEVVNEAQPEVREGMKEGRRAVNLIQFAQTFGIEFDDTPLQRYLSQRKQTGGLNNRELVAEFFLAELRMNPRDRAEFLEREEDRLSQVLSKASLAGKRIEALVQDGQIVRARDLLETHRDAFVAYDYDRLQAMIDVQEGSDPRAQLETLYHQTDSLLDLKNLVAHLKHTGDWTALRPLLQELFRRERTIENAIQCVASMRHSPQINNTDIIAFLEENQDMVDRSLDLVSEKAWALSYVGRLKEAEAMLTLLAARDSQNDLLLETNLAIQSGNWEQFSVIISRMWPKREELDPSVLMRLASLAAEA